MKHCRKDELPPAGVDDDPQAVTDQTREPFELDPGVLPALEVVDRDLIGHLEADELFDVGSQGVLGQHTIDSCDQFSSRAEEVGARDTDPPEADQGIAVEVEVILKLNS